MEKIILLCCQALCMFGFLIFLFYCCFAVYDLARGDWLSKIGCISLIYFLYRLVKHFIDEEDVYPKD